MHGIDVSNNNGRVDWPAVARAGIGFAFAKATEGLTFVDKFFDGASGHNARDAAAAGLLFAPYHFAHPDQDPIAQVEFFLRIAPGPYALPHMLDVEASGGDPGSWTERAAAELTRRTGRAPIIYTGSSFAGTHLAYHPALAAYPLFLANYRAAAPPAPAPWSHWAIWQYTSGGQVPGVGGRCDLSVADDAVIAALANQEPDMTTDELLDVLGLKNLDGTHQTIRDVVKAVIAEECAGTGASAGAIKAELDGLGNNVNIHIAQAVNTEADMLGYKHPYNQLPPGVPEAKPVVKA